MVAWYFTTLITLTDESPIMEALGCSELPAVLNHAAMNTLVDYIFVFLPDFSP